MLDLVCAQEMNPIPRCAAQQQEGVRRNSEPNEGRLIDRLPKLLSLSVLTFSSAAGAQKLGHPVPESNFSSLRNSAVPQQAHL